MRIFQKGFHYGQDGPGNRLVYHLQGCNLHCPWCSNPEGMARDGGGEECSVEDVFSECLRSRAMFFSGGGVTFTGGECTLQWQELSWLLRCLREAGIHTAIETNGTSPHLRELLPHVDYLIMDFKHFDGDALLQSTGVGNAVLRENFERHCREGVRQHIRIPLINGFNADCPMGFATYFSAQDTKNTVFEFLPYHEYGKGKWTEEYRIADGFVSPENLAEYKRIFEEYGLKIITT